MSTAYTFVASPFHAYPDHPEHPSRFELLSARLDSFGAQKLEAEPATCVMKWPACIIQI